MESKSAIVYLLQDSDIANAVLTYLRFQSNINFITDMAYSTKETSCKSKLDKHVEIIKSDKYQHSSHGTYTISRQVYYGDWTIDHEGVPIHCRYDKSPEKYVLFDRIDHYETLVLTCDTHATYKENSLALDSFMVTCMEKVEEPDLDHRLKLFIHNEKDCSWKFLNYVPTRDADTVFYPKKKSLLDDLQLFMDHEEDYNKYGIPYKRNYLFHGPPGSGKSSCIRLMASKMKCHVYIMSFSSRCTDAMFIKLLSLIRNNSILVLEDIDNLFRDNTLNHSVSLSTILNALDGLTSKRKLITCITTNHINKLPEELIRVGRIDGIYTFKHANPDQLKELLLNYFNHSHLDGESQVFARIFASLKQKILDTPYSMAALQKFVFERRHRLHDLDQDVEDLDAYGDRSTDTVNHMYT